MPFFTDQCNRTISLPGTPLRIVSLVPSQTELLYDLGLTESVVGITKFCVHPEKWFRSKTRVGGTKYVNMDIVHSLQPDLVIANKEENTKEQVDAIAANYPVWISDIGSLKDALQMINDIGDITGTMDQANDLIVKIDTGFLELSEQVKIKKHKPATAYFIWQNPYMAAGGDTFIHSMMEHCGLENIFKDTARYPEATIEHLQNANCRLLLLSSEPFPFKEKHIETLQQQLPDTKILLADGEMFSWYGSRLLHAPTYFKQLLKQVWK